MWFVHCRFIRKPILSWNRCKNQSNMVAYTTLAKLSGLGIIRNKMALVLRKGVVLPADKPETIKPITTNIEGYFGLKKFQYTTTKHIITTLNEYILDVMNNAVNWMYEIHKKIQIDYTGILLQMFYTIARYNKHILPDDIKFRAEDLAIPGLECMYIKDNIIHFNCDLIDKFLEVNSRRNVHITLPEIMDNEELSFRQDNVPAISETDTLLLYKLFIIADHFATHYFENKSNYIFHYKFGTKGAFTLHSQLCIETIDLQKKLQRTELTKFVTPMYN